MPSCGRGTCGEGLSDSGGLDADERMRTKGRLALAGRLRHGAGDFAEDGTDAGGHMRHNRARRHGHEASHERVLNQVLSFIVI